MNPKKINWKNKKIWLVGVTVIIVAIILCICLFARQAREVNVLEYRGSVAVERPSISDLLSVFKGMRLEEGDFIQTGEASNVTMTIDDNKIAKLAENSRASFDEVAEGKGGQVTSIYLESGTLINDIKEKLSEDSSYKVNTPNATVSVRGTYFVVYVGQEEGYEGVVTKINVYDGSVEVENMNGEVVILYANKESVTEGSGKEMNSAVILPSGNHALVGEKEITIFDYVDFMGLDESDLKRLEELVKEGKSPIALEDIEARLKQLTGMPVEETTNAKEEVTTITPEETEKTSEEDKKEDLQEKEIKNSGKKSEPEKQKPKTENPKTEDTANGFIDAPIIKVIPQEIPPVNTQNNSGGESGGDGAPVTPPPSEPQPEPPEENYDSLLLLVVNLAEIEQQMAELQSKTEIMEEIASSSNDSGWKTQIQQAKNDIGQTQSILDSVEKVNLVLTQINGLPQPAQITEIDRERVGLVRAAYESLTGDERILVPESSLKKVIACEGKI